MIDTKLPRWLIGILLVFIFLFGLGLRYWRWCAEPIISRDGIYYIGLAEKWFSGAPYESATTPLLIWGMKSLMHLGMTGENAGVLINLVLGSLLPLLMFCLVKVVLESDKAGIVAAAFAAVYPAWVKLSHEVQRETMYLFFLLIFLVLVTLALKYKQQCYWFAAGVVSFPALLTRYEFLEMPVLLFCVMIWLWIVNKADRKKIVRVLFNYLGGVLLSAVIVSLVCGIPLSYYKLWGYKFENYFSRVISLGHY